MQKLAMFDLDGTLFRWQLYHALVFEFKDFDVFSDETIVAIDSAYLAWEGRTKSWDDYELVVMTEFKKYLPSMPVATFEKAAHNVVEKSGHRVYNYTKKLAKNLKEQGYFLLAVTGSYQEISEPFAKLYGFDACIGALLPRENGVFTGPDSERATIGRKDELAREFAEQNRLSFDGSVAIGDSGSDIKMLELATYPIAFNPSTDLLETALDQNWKIVIERKNIAYTLEEKDGHVVLAQTDNF